MKSKLVAKPKAPSQAMTITCKCSSLEKKSVDSTEVEVHAPGPEEAWDEMTAKTKGPAVSRKEIGHLLGHREGNLDCWD